MCFALAADRTHTIGEQLIPHLEFLQAMGTGERFKYFEETSVQIPAHERPRPAE